jgi:hypothetical protein
MKHGEGDPTGTSIPNIWRQKIFPLFPRISIHIVKFPMFFLPSGPHDPELNELFIYAIGSSRSLAQYIVLRFAVHIMTSTQRLRFLSVLF